MTAPVDRRRSPPGYRDRVTTQARRVRRVIRRVDPWSVLRFSLVFYACMLVVGMVAGFVLWAAASTTGLIDNIERFFEELFALESFTINGGLIFRSTLIGGLVLVLLGTGANVLMSVLYNLTSDVVGGVEVTVLEEQPARSPVL